MHTRAKDLVLIYHKWHYTETISFEISAGICYARLARIYVPDSSWPLMLSNECCKLLATKRLKIWNDGNYELVWS